MTLRPRYSLLTLLLLTTAVAVGIKLWRGPHRVLFTNPTIAQLEEITQTPVANYHRQNINHQGTTFEYRYRNTWSGRELLTVQCNYPESLLVITGTSDGWKRTFLWPASLGNASHGDCDGDEAVCWISGKLKIVYKPGPRVFDNPHYGPAYIVTSRKHIYLIELMDLKPLFKVKIELGDIEDAEVRTQIQNVLDLLPQQQ